MTEPAPFRFEGFEGRVGTAFIVESADDPIELRLDEAEDRGRTPWGSDAFSLIFSGSSDRPLDQAIHRLSAEDGAIEIFLVPLGPEGDRMRYQAVFS